MTPFVIAILAGFLVMDAVIVALILRATAFSWNGLAGAHPAVDPAPDAIRRGFQSFSIGAINLGFCVHVLVDEERLHLRPAWILRVMGGREVSVPWESVDLAGNAPFGRRFARIGGKTLTGPRWCLDLADPTGARDKSEK